MGNMQGVDKLVGIVEVRSGEQVEMPLGDFKDNQPPIGFRIMVESDPQSDDLSVHTIKRKKGVGYELILEMANSGGRTLVAEVFQMYQQKQKVGVGVSA